MPKRSLRKKKDSYKGWSQISEHHRLPAATSHTHVCKRRRGPSSRWATSRTRSMWGCCTAWTWRCGRCAPPPAEGSRGKVHSEFTCVCIQVFCLCSLMCLYLALPECQWGLWMWVLDTVGTKPDLQYRCPSSFAFSAQVWLPAALKTKTKGALKSHVPSITLGKITITSYDFLWILKKWDYYSELVKNNWIKKNKWIQMCLYPAECAV